MKRLNPFAGGDEATDAETDLDPPPTQSLLHRPPKAPPLTHADSPSKERRPTASRSSYFSRLGALRIALVFVVGLTAGVVLHSFLDTGMTDVRDAIAAAQRAKNNVMMLASTARDGSTGITRVREDAFPMRIMTFNLRYGTAQDGPNSWRYRRAHAADIINRYVPVILGTQEGLAEQLTEFQAMLARPYERFGEPRETNGEHVQIFYDTSVVERLDGGTFWLSPTPDVPGSRGWDAGCVRIATWCRFRFLSTNQIFYHVNTHLDSQGRIARFEGAKVVWAEMKKVLKRDGLPATTPLLLTGDFNTFRPSNAFQFLTRDTNGPQMQDSWTAASHQIGNISCTFHEFLGPIYDTLPHDDWHDPDMDPLNRVGTNHIDFVLSRPPLPTIVTEVITEAWDGRYPSDHYPVMATLLFPSAIEMPPQ